MKRLNLSHFGVGLVTALNCVAGMKEDGVYNGERVGRIVKECPGEVGSLNRGQIVLFREELDPPRDMQMGEFRGITSRPTGTLTVEVPMSSEELEAHRRKRPESLIRTYGTMVDVPDEYVREIICLE